MATFFRRSAWALLILLIVAALAAFFHVRAKRPQREGTLALAGLQAPVQVRYDEFGVPHLKAGNETDLYRALGYLHAQDRLFQMEMLRRLSRGELAEILGPKLVETDRLFRTLHIRTNADTLAARLDPQSPAGRTLAAYLDGVNQFQARGRKPLEFEILGIPQRPFTAADTYSIAGYLAFSFAATFRSEPVLTHIRDKLGPQYLKAFDLDWHPQGVTDSPALARLALLATDLQAATGLPQFEGSNAWAIAGSRTASGKPLLAGDPHIAFSVPAVWWEAHLQSPGFELYGHFAALNPMALLGHNQRFGWTLTMFQNDDMDLVAEKLNPANPNQVWANGAWADISTRTETIAVKGQAPLTIQLRRTPHGPILNDAPAGPLGGGAGVTPAAAPIAMWWVLLDSENPVLQAFHALNRADTLDKARQAASQIHAPGLNVVWANAAGDIGWWAAARLPQRPAGADPNFILDGATPAADTPRFLPFSANPQEENPARGFVVSANHQPAGATPVPGYYNLADRAQRLQQRLGGAGAKFTPEHSRALQLDAGTGYAQRLLAPLLPVLRARLTAADDLALLAQLEKWPGDYPVDSVAATVFAQFRYELAKQAMADELGDEMFSLVLRTRVIDDALVRLAADEHSPWWDRRGTNAVETRADTVGLAWGAAVSHLRGLYGPDSTQWTWGRAHTLTHGHPLGRQAPLDKVFNVGPLPSPGGREMPNNLAEPLGPAPWAVNYGPSTRRVIDFAAPGQSQGINPVGQSGVWGDQHYADQAQRHIRGDYRGQWLDEADVAAHTRSTLVMSPAP
jgi:penicillin amidase